MPFTATVHHGPYLLLVATGTAKVCDVLGLIDLAARVAEVQGYQRTLFDLISVEVQLTPLDKARLGEHAAKQLAHIEKAASVVSEIYAETKREAKEPDLRFRTFTDLRQATNWLSS